MAEMKKCQLDQLLSVVEIGYKIQRGRGGKYEVRSVENGIVRPLVLCSGSYKRCSSYVRSEMKKDREQESEDA